MAESTPTPANLGSVPQEQLKNMVSHALDEKLIKPPTRDTAAPVILGSTLSQNSMDKSKISTGINTQAEKRGDEPWVDIDAQSTMPLASNTAATGTSRYALQNFAAPMLSDARITTRRVRVEATTRSVVPLGFDLPFSGFPDNPNVGMSYRNREEATQAMSKLVETWTSPSPDSTIPTAIEQRRAYVLRLFLAFTNIEGHLNAGRAGSWKDVVKYDKQSMGKVCWDIVAITERLHTEGPHFLLIYDPRTLAQIRKDSILTFEQRIQCLILLTGLYKSRVEDFMKDNGTVEIIAAARQKLGMAKVNKGQNKSKAKTLHAGRQALGLASGNGRPLPTATHDKSANLLEDVAAPIAAIDCVGDGGGNTGIATDIEGTMRDNSLKSEESSRAGTNLGLSQAVPSAAPASLISCKCDIPTAQGSETLLDISGVANKRARRK